MSCSCSIKGGDLTAACGGGDKFAARITNGGARIKATAGFERLGAATATSPKSLVRRFGTRGNPQAHNLIIVIGDLQKQAGVAFLVAPAPRLQKLYLLRP